MNRYYYNFDYLEVIGSVNKVNYKSKFIDINGSIIYFNDIIDIDILKR